MWFDEGMEGERGESSDRALCNPEEGLLWVAMATAHTCFPSGGIEQPCHSLTAHSFPLLLATPHDY